jgi:hypothetical protein
VTGILGALNAAPYYSVTLNSSIFHARSSTSVTASCTFAAAGTVSGSSSGSTSANTSYTWLNAGPAAGLEIYAELTSGTLSAGTTGEWLSLASDRTWSHFQFSDGTTSAFLSVSIRNAATQVVIAGPVTVRLTAENE